MSQKQNLILCFLLNDAAPFLLQYKPTWEQKTWLLPFSMILHSCLWPLSKSKMINTIDYHSNLCSFTYGVN